MFVTALAFEPERHRRAIWRKFNSGGTIQHSTNRNLRQHEPYEPKLYSSKHFLYKSYIYIKKPTSLRLVRNVFRLVQNRFRAREPKTTPGRALFQEIYP